MRGDQERGVRFEEWGGDEEYMYSTLSGRGIRLMMEVGAADGWVLQPRWRPMKSSLHAGIKH